MTLVASSRSVAGTLRQEVLVDGQHLLVTDEPPSVGGEGSAPSPHELVAAAMAACVSTTIVMYARTKGWELGEVAVDVAYDQRAAPPRAVVEVRVDGELTEEQLTRLEKVAAACPVRRALATGISFEERIVSPVR